MTAPNDHLLARASLHLHRAAIRAERRHDTLAAQVRLAAAMLLTVDTGELTDIVDVEDIAVEDGRDLPGELGLALNCLDQIPPLTGPADLQLCAWHIHELRRIATGGVLA